MSDQTGEVVEAQPAVRHLPAKDDFPAMRVDHYTLRVGDQHYPITAYRPLTDAVAAVGDSLTGEFQGADKWDKDRNKFRVKQQATAGGAPAPSIPTPAAPVPTSTPAPVAPPPPSGGVPIGGIFPTTNAAPHPPPAAQPVPAPAVPENGSSRLERLLAIVGAALYFEVRAMDHGEPLEDWTLRDLFNIADELQYNAAVGSKPTDPLEPDTRDLPTAN